MESAHIAVITTTDENRLSPSIRKPLLDKKPQIVRLSTDVAYDATHALMWFVVVMFFMLGSPEIATAIGLFEVLKGGKRASKET